MIPFVIPVSQARRYLSRLLNEAFHRGRPFLLTKNQKPMAIPLGAREFAQIMKLVEKHDPGIADTLAILADPELLEAIEQGEKDVKTGRTIPIGELLQTEWWSIVVCSPSKPKVLLAAPLAVACGGGHHEWP